MIDASERQKLIAEIQKFSLMDDTFFNCFMADNIKGMEYVLRIIMDKHDLKVLRVETQHEIPNLYARSVRFDVFATDDAGREYNIEIQNSTSGAIPKRARYNSGMLDYRTLAAGSDWDKLPEAYVIFITAKDVLQGNSPIYHIDRVIRETNRPFQDDSHIIYVNGAFEDDETELGQLIHDFKCRKADEMNSTILADRMKELKNTDKGVSTMCEIMEEYGRQREIAESVKRMHYCRRVSTKLMKRQ